MADDRFCRFATKVVANGVTLVDGMLSALSIDTIVNRLLLDNKLPRIDLSSLYTSAKGHHVHYDISHNGNFIAFEVYALSGPVLADT